MAIYTNNPGSMRPMKLGVDYGANIMGGEPDYEEMLRKKRARKDYEDYMSASAQGQFKNPYLPEQDKLAGAKLSMDAFTKLPNTPVSGTTGPFNTTATPAFTPLTEEQKKRPGRDTRSASQKLEDFKASGELMQLRMTPEERQRIEDPGNQKKTALERKNKELEEAKAAVYRLKNAALAPQSKGGAMINAKNLAKAQLRLEQLRDTEV